MKNKTKRKEEKRIIFNCCNHINHAYVDAKCITCPHCVQQPQAKQKKVWNCHFGVSHVIGCPHKSWTKTELEKVKQPAKDQPIRQAQRKQECDCHYKAKCGDNPDESCQHCQKPSTGEWEKKASELFWSIYQAGEQGADFGLVDSMMKENFRELLSAQQKAIVERKSNSHERGCFCPECPKYPLKKGKTT